MHKNTAERNLPLRENFQGETGEYLEGGQGDGYNCTIIEVKCEKTNINGNNNLY
ncbi:MAG: hypothetical protein NZ901_06800 [Geminocystis sp.]|nr:hypothetical protein [Geminocystis sp.]HIK38767.1 hypothetical protein [Geminocystis sp. M7585_C2015_104]MCS7147884.1 hypothetical protein [Geminocystis sp.]MCX8078710.1 hypothetical protein [Geminocystis sp.]MDW8117028.1 hypothetical protein [Geminocystis sp.]